MYAKVNYLGTRNDKLMNLAKIRVMAQQYNFNQIKEAVKHNKSGYFFPSCIWNTGNQHQSL